MQGVHVPSPPPLGSINQCISPLYSPVTAFLAHYLGLPRIANNLHWFCLALGYQRDSLRITKMQPCIASNQLYKIPSLCIDSKALSYICALFQINYTYACTIRAPVFDRNKNSAPQSNTVKPMEVYYLDEWLIHCFESIVQNTFLCMDSKALSYICALFHILRAPVFGRNQNSPLQSIYQKSHGSLLSGWEICNYTVCCRATTCTCTSSNILIVDHNSIKGALKVMIALF